VCYLRPKGGGGGGPKGPGIPQIRAHCSTVRAANGPKFGECPISLGTLKLEGSGRVLTHIRKEINLCANEFTERSKVIKT
jgi:hypothetical protein